MKRRTFDQNERIVRSIAPVGSRPASEPIKKSAEIVEMSTSDTQEILLTSSEYSSKDKL